MLYRYRLYEADGSEAGEAHYAVMIKPGETIWTGDGRKLRVVDVVPVEEEDSPYVGLLKSGGDGLTTLHDSRDRWKLRGRRLARADSVRSSVTIL